MSTQTGNRGEAMERATGAGAGMGGNGGSTSGTGAHGASPDLNMGSARSDYGENAYGGSLDEQGLGGAGYDDFDEGRGDTEGGVIDGGGTPVLRSATSSTGGRTKGRGYSLGDTGNTGLTLLAGIAIGAGLMYLFDPEHGGRRRALLRDKLMSLSNDATEALGKTSRDLRSRAQGVIAETTKAMGLGGGGTETGESSATGGNAQGGSGMSAENTGSTSGQ